MRVWHVILFFILTFFWIWSLPILIASIFIYIPFAIIALPLCIAVTLTLQFFHHDKIIASHFVRAWISAIPWHEWFPCNQLCFEDQCIIAVHPHGLLCCGAIAGIHLVPKSKTVLCVAPILFYVPIIGWILRVIGCIPAKKHEMQNAIQLGHSLLVIPGGVPEIVLTETQDDTRRFPRHGILRLTPKIPVHIVTVRGECSTFRIYQGPLIHLRLWLSWKLNIPFIMPFILGYYGTWLPKRRPLQLYTLPLIPRNKEKYAEILDQCWNNNQINET